MIEKYYLKYLKYKKKYLEKKQQKGGSSFKDDLPVDVITAEDLKPRMKDNLHIIFEKYEIEPYLFTKKIFIAPDYDTIPHSHPVLTISARYLLNKEFPIEKLLIMFIHEQLHWFEEENKDKFEIVRAELKKLYPNVRLQPPFGSRFENSTYNHIIICFFEYKIVKKLINDDERTDKLYENPKFYIDIYETIFKYYDKIEKLLNDNDLIIS